MIPSAGIAPVEFTFSDTRGMSGNQELAIRRSTRHDVVIPARIRVAPVHSAAVKLSAASGVRDGWLDVDVVDFSSGGVGILSPVFLPRGCVLTVRLLTPADEGNPESMLLEVQVRVQRVVMTDRRPAYLMGTAFDSLTPETAAGIEGLLKRMEGATFAA